MKRLIYSNTETEELLLDLDVEVVISGTILSSEEIPYDFQDSAFYAFESDILNACEIHGFELQDSYVSNRNGSNSQYYVYIKTNEDGTKLKIFLKIRISDHSVPDKVIKGKNTTYKQRDSRYVKDKVAKFAKETFNQTRGYKMRTLDIVFDDMHFRSYESALRHIENKLDEFDPE